MKYFPKLNDYCICKNTLKEKYMITASTTSTVSVNKEKEKETDMCHPRFLSWEFFFFFVLIFLSTRVIRITAVANRR